MTLFNLKNINYYNYLFPIIIICFCFVNNHGFDSDWNVYIYDQYINTGILYNTLFEVTPSFSRMSHFLNASLLKIFDYPNSFVFQSLLLSFIGYYSLYFTLKKLSINGNSKYLLLLLFISVGISSGVLTNSRVEIIYVNLLYLQIYLISILSKSNTFLKLFLICFIGVISFSSHPNGIINLFVFGLSILFYFKKEFIFKILTISIINLIILYNTLFYKISFNDFYASLVIQKNSSGYINPWYLEFQRYLHLFKENIEISIIILFLLVVALVNFKQLINAITYKNQSVFNRQILIIILFILFYLTFFNGSKISYWYLSLLFPPILILFSLIIKNFSQKHSKQLIYFFVLLNLYSISLKVLSNEIFIINYVPTSISKNINRVNKINEIIKEYSQYNVSVEPEIYVVLRKSIDFKNIHILQTKSVDHNTSDYIITKYNTFRDQFEKSNYQIVDTFKLSNLNYVILEYINNE